MATKSRIYVSGLDKRTDATRRDIFLYLFSGLLTALLVFTLLPIIISMSNHILASASEDSQSFRALQSRIVSDSEAAVGLRIHDGALNFVGHCLNKLLKPESPQDLLSILLLLTAAIIIVFGFFIAITPY